MQFFQCITDFIFVEDEPQRSDIIFVPGGSYPDAAMHAAQLYHAGYAPYIMPSGKYSILTGRFVMPETGIAVRGDNGRDGRTGADAGADGAGAGVDGADAGVGGADVRVGGAGAGVGGADVRVGGAGARVGIVQSMAEGTGIAGVSDANAQGRLYTTECEYLCDILRRCGVPEQAILREDQATYTYENAIFSRRRTEALGLEVRRALLCCQAFHARRSLMYYQEQFPETEFLVCPVVTKGISRENWHCTRAGIDTVLGEVERCGGQFHEILYEKLPPEQ